MSGHSKWSTIKHQKAANDAKRGKLFSRLAANIAIAVREGGGDDPDGNPRLRLAIEQARGANMPKDNIARAIERGLGKSGQGTLESLTWEGFGPGGIAVIVESVTENRNRTSQEIRSFFDKRGGKLGETGSVSYLFDRVGMLSFSEQKTDKIEELMLGLIDCGAEDVEQKNGQILAYTKPEQLHQVLSACQNKLRASQTAGIIYRPKSPRRLDNNQAKKAEEFLENLAALDDVQEVYSDL